MTVAEDIDLDRAFNERDPGEFIDWIARHHSVTYDEGRRLLFSLIDSGKLELTNRWTLIRK